MAKMIQEIKALVDLCIKTQVIEFLAHQIDNHSILLKEGIINKTKSNPKLLKLNNNSIQFNSALLNIAVAKLNKPITDNMIDAFGFIEEFQEKLKEENLIAKNTIKTQPINNIGLGLKKLNS